MSLERLRLKKLIHTVAYLLSLNDWQMNYTKIIKLLYIIDKKALSQWDMTVTNDSYVSLKNGPVLSQLYDLIKDRYCKDALQNYWDSFFHTESFSLVCDKKNVPCDELSKAEKKLIENVDREFKAFNYSDLIDYVHNPDKFPEWQDPGTSSLPITIKDILQSLGRSDSDIETIIEEIELYKKEQDILLGL